MKYYAGLSKTQIKNLYKFYEYDFEIFDYSYTEYLRVGTDEVEDSKDSKHAQIFVIN